MKKYSFLLMGAVGLMFAACDETDIPESIPQHNPQEEVLAPGDITVTDQGPLASTAVFNLNNYADDPETLIPVLTLTEAINVPEGADISFHMVMSNSDSFEQVYTLYPQYGTGSSEESKAGDTNTLYVTAGDWNNAHLYLFGKNPTVTKEMYYRIPVFINVDGSSFSYVAADYYIAQGTVTEYCIDQGFVIEDNYYFLSNATTWDLGSASLDYAMYHNPDVSVYDDPVFTYVFTQSGDNWWKIAPASAVATGDWSNVLGTIEDGDDSPSGLLTDIDAQAGKIAGAGKYEIKANIETMSYNVYTLTDGIYLVGAPQGWDVTTSNILLEETAPGSNIYSIDDIHIGKDEFIFRFYHVLGDWNIGSIGSNNTGANQEISLADGSYSGPVFQEGVNASSAQGNWQIPGWEGGDVSITINLNDFTITISEVASTVEYVNIYLRGDMNGWAASSSWQFIATDQENVFVLKNVTIPAETKFKIADSDWGSCNFGVAEGTVLDVGQSYNLTYNDKDITLSTDFTGDVVVTYDATAQTMSVIFQPAE